MDLQGRNGHINSLGAASDMYEDKRRKYKDTDGTLYPIIFLATGRPSKQLTTICQELHTRSSLPERVFMKHWRTFLRDSMRTCSKFIANAHRNRPHLSQVHHQPTFSQMKSRREQTQRIQKLTTKFMKPRPEASNSSNIHTNNTQNNDGNTNSNADANSANTSNTDMIINTNMDGNKSTTAESQTANKTTGTIKTDSNTIADSMNDNNNIDSNSNTETPINNNTDSSGNADTATTTLHDTHVEHTLPMLTQSFISIKEMMKKVGLVETPLISPKIVIVSDNPGVGPGA